MKGVRMIGKFIVSFLIIWLSTSLVMLFGKVAGFELFAFETTDQMVGQALTLTVVANVLFYALSMAIWLPLKVKNPGLVIPTLIGVIAGATAIWLTGYFLPGTVLLASFWSMLAFSLVNTVLIWAFTLGMTGVPQRPMWPQR